MDEVVTKKVENFFSSFKIRAHKKGEILIRAYDNPKGIIYLVDGLVKMYSISKNGDEFVLNVFKPFSFFPMSWIVSNSKNHYFYETMAPSKTRLAPTQKVNEFIKSNPDVLFDLLKRVFIGIEGLLIKMAYAMSGEAYSRLIAELLTEAKRFGKKNGRIYELKISESDLATEVGLARETVSREIKLLKNKGLIKVKNKKLTIINIGKLEEELS